MLVEKIDEYMGKQNVKFPCHENRVSSIGHPCVKYLTYLRTNWEDRVLNDDLVYIFNEGNLQEDSAVEVLRQLTHVGVQLSRQQEKFEDVELNLSGHIDGVIKNDGVDHVWEFKSMSPFVFDGIDTIDDLYHPDRIWLQGYIIQLNCYMKLSGIHKGILMFKNKSTGKYKEFLLDFNEHLWDSTVEKAKLVNLCVRGKEEAPKLQQPVNCLRCGFVHICTPDMDFGTGIEFMDSAEIECMLDRKHELSEHYKEYNKLNKELKKTFVAKAFKDHDNFMFGDWLVGGKLILRKAYSVKESEYWKPKYTNLKEEKP